MNNSSELGSGSESDSGSGTNEEECPPNISNTLEVAFKAAALIAVFFLSLIGNVLVVRVIHKNRRLRKVSHLLVINLAAADLLITLTSMPEAIKVELTRTNQWFGGAFGLAMCKLLPFCQTVSVSCSILSLVVISFDKYVSIVYPLKRIMSRKRLRLVIPLVWFASAVTALPQLIANNLEHDPDGSVWCVEKWPPPFDPQSAPRDYTIVYLVVLYLFPLGFMTILYARVFAVISRRKVPGNCTAASIRLQVKSRRKAGKMFVVVILCFALCWLTQHIAFFLLYFVPDYSACGPPEAVWFFAGFFALSNSAINPCIYFLMNKTYRKELMTIFRCQGNPSLSSDITTATRTRQVTSYAQEVSQEAVPLQLFDFGISRKMNATSQGEVGGITLLYFRTLPQDV